MSAVLSKQTKKASCSGAMDGQMFNARKLGDFPLTAGDAVEVIISDIDGDQYVIKALDIFSEGEAGNKTSAAGANGETAQKQPAVFTRHPGKGRFLKPWRWLRLNRTFRRRLRCFWPRTVSRCHRKISKR